MIQLLTLRVVLLFLSTQISYSSALPRQTERVARAGNQLSRLEHRASVQDYVGNAVAGINQMDNWYDVSNGVWQNAWWNSANALTMLADFQGCFPSAVEALTAEVFPNTLAQAPSYGNFAGFINGYYDDELWWTLAWIKVYDVTGDSRYLETASSIFENSKQAWGSSPCGGLWWDKAHTQVGAVENELYLTAAAKLANRAPNGGDYLDEAKKAYEWFMKSGLINSENLVNNGLLLTTCKNDGGLVFTYNQGIILSGLAELSRATGDNSYNELANTLALAGMDHLTDSNGILHEVCEGTAAGCDGDEAQFKGIFARNINFLYQHAANLPADTAAKYRTFLRVNADSVWAHDQSNDLMGLGWSGPAPSPGEATIQTQSSALDVIVGAACVS